MKCPNCGKKIENDSKFCETCGFDLSSLENLTSKNFNNEAEQNDNSNKSTLDKLNLIALDIMALLGIASIVMTVLALLGVFNKNPIPFILFVGIVYALNWVDDKFPKIPKILIATTAIILLILCFKISTKSDYVASVKTSTPDAYPSISYEDAFDNYFSNPKWKQIKDNTDGNPIVKFTGTCSYDGYPAVAEITFTIYEDQRRFAITSMKIDGNDMGIYTDSIIDDIFYEY
ncbi:MAG: zinc-ribbon domain-containing protein [Pseudobutyrivibrio ruminis]|nr:zinc-ribbon domain-containing protein [Pseudobutyrivibrio ruminis]